MKESKAAISIIIPAYNTAAYMDKCLASVSAQSITDLEIIVVNDGSSDATPLLCNAWAEKDPRIRVIHTENKGVAEARNTGLREARADFVGFVDSDDWIEPDMYETLYASIQHQHADISICSVLNEASNGRLRHYQSYEKKERIWEDEQALHELLRGKHLKSYLCNMLFRKSLFKDLAFQAGRVFEDLGMLYKVFSRAHRVAHTGKSSYHYVQRAESILNAQYPQKEIDYFNVNAEIYEFVAQSDKLSPADKASILRQVILRLIKTHRKLLRMTPSEAYVTQKEEMKNFIKGHFRQHYNPHYYPIYRLLLI